MEFRYRYVAQIVVEALTPLAIGSDSLQYDQDAPVDKDFNDLPYIPGTAITGYLQKQLPKLESLFGEKPDSNSDEPKGSNIIVSEAFLMDKKGEVLQQPKIIKDEFLKKYSKLPIRQHTAINEFGAASDGSKFDTEIVFKGSRFKFEIELQVAIKMDADWKTILNAFFQNNFYLGAGEFNNFGELKVIEIKEKAFDLKKDLDNYSGHNVDLNDVDDDIFKPYKKPKINRIYNTCYLKLSGKDSFFHFGAGYGDTEVDNINYSELVLEWSADNKPTWVEKFVIPGTSIKGTLAHRVAFHYNKENNVFVENLIPAFEESVSKQLNKKYKIDNFKLADSIAALEKQKSQLETHLKALEKEALNTAILFEDYIGINNKGVTGLFGTAKDSKKDKGSKGTIIIKDIYLPIDTPQTIFTHNKIDRYTGGTIDTALFNEKVLAIDEVTLSIKSTEKIAETNETTKYLQMTLNDLKKGMLPLGGLVNKGHGIFTELKTTKDETK
ncbi:hypothetical protein Lupro_02530 [Lutibacter profundi]|uniref:CRISPR type III-associated protein domain-containing protein n=1 Tax=Lutibacter profundi TaxID=1622118 RepID=A0A120IE11_9FLAO|nr:RAMP superfamily CRISPR-associated protein [Lutibacter profundi]AMC10195.1 hypothetical protein Lupro_02530 [Lutibacter profundi]